MCSTHRSRNWSRNASWCACWPIGVRSIPASSCITRAAGNCRRPCALSSISRKPRQNSSASSEHRLALVNKRLHGLLVIRRRRQTDQAFRLVVARGGEVEQQGFVEIVFHVTQGNRRPFRHRFGERKSLGLKPVVRHQAV